MAEAKYPSTPATRWSAELARRGYTPVVHGFIEHAGRRSGKGGGLGLNPTQAMLVIQLMSYKRDVRMPFPAIKTLASRMGLSDATVRANLDGLVRKKLLVKHLRRGTTAQYDLRPLFDRLEVIQAQAEAKKARSKAEAEAMRLPEYYDAKTTAKAEAVPPLAHV